MEHKLKTLQYKHESYVKTYNSVIQELLDFEDKHKPPLGININSDRQKQLQYGTITVTIRPTQKHPEIKYTYDTKIHPTITEELHLKLYRIETTIIKQEQRRTKKYTYYYTYKDNPQYVELTREEMITM